MIRLPGREREPVDPAVAEAQKKARFRRRVVFGVIAAVLVVIGYFVGAAFLPRWWARRIAELTQDSFTRGLLYGLAFGLVFTLVPLLIASSAFWRRMNAQVRTGVVVLAVLVSAPNLLTLGISTGSGSGAHAGARIMDDRAPFFQGATLIGAILAVVLFALGWWQYRAGRRVRQAKRTAKQRSRTEVEPGPDPTTAP